MSEWAGRLDYDEANVLSQALSESFVRGCRENDLGGLVLATESVVFSWEHGADEPTFARLVKLKDGRFAAVSGWHDYTGWDCQSGVTVDHVAGTLGECVPFLVDDPRREYEASRG